MTSASGSQGPPLTPGAPRFASGLFRGCQMQGSQHLSHMLGTYQPPSPVSAFPKPCQQGWKGKQPVVAVPALGPPDPLCSK